MPIDKIGLIALANDVLDLLYTDNVGDFNSISSNTIISNTSISTNTFTANTITANNYVLGNITVTVPFLFMNLYQYTSNGVYVKPANLAFIRVIAQGPGGGGGSATCNSASTRNGGGGGGGASCESVLYPTQLANVETITIGIRGLGGANAVNGANGTNTVFGNNSLIVAGGGRGGNCNMRGVLPFGYPAGGAGGSAFEGDIRNSGFAGEAGYTLSGLNQGGKGGNSFYGEGKMSDCFANGATGAAGYGAGGPGGTAVNNPSIQLGCNGSNGVMWIHEYYYPRVVSP